MKDPQFFSEEEQAASEPDFYGKWIDVDKSPTEGIFVLVCGKDIRGVCIGKYTPYHANDFTTFTCMDENGIFVCDVTHWMSMPEPFNTNKQEEV